jgi:hypothetical protein
MTTATLERTKTTTTTLTTIDRAIASEDWQAAYDGMMSARIGSPAALKRLLTVANELHQRGASDAALDVLNRGFDTYQGIPQLYFQLVHVLVALDREDDAKMALELLQASTVAR